jgi:multimeric flavodoxin WrbA
MEDAEGIARAHTQSDLLVLLTPVTFGGYSSELKKALDRMICALLPFFQTVDGETHHRPRYDRYPKLLAIGVDSRRDEESERIFARLVERNAINLWAPAWAAGILGNGKFDGTLRAIIQALLRQVEVA